MISDKMHKLGWKPKIPWEEGIRRTSRGFLAFVYTVAQTMDLCFKNESWVLRLHFIDISIILLILVSNAIKF